MCESDAFENSFHNLADRCNSSIYMRSLAYLSFDFLFGVFCSRISQRSLFWTSAAQHDRFIERRERERTNGRQKNGKNLKWMKPVPSVVLTIPFFISLTRSAVATIFFENENTAFSSEKKCQDLPNACRSLPRPVPAMNNLRKTFLFSAFTSANGFKLLLLFFLGK